MIKNRELLFSITKKDLTIQWFSGTGAGGQYRNKNQNCCRIIHKGSGAVVVAQEERSQKQNLKNALYKLKNNPKFKVWLNRKIYELSEQYKKDIIEIEQKVNEALKEENLLIEYEIKEDKK